MVGAHTGSNASIAARIRVGLLGEWSTLRERKPEIFVGSALISRCPQDPILLRNIALRLSPSWLVLGQGLDDDRLVSLANLVQLAIPDIRLMVLGSTNELDRFDRWLGRGARAYLRSTVQPAQALRVMSLADEVDVAVVSKMVGHSSVTLTLNTYRHIFEKAQRSAASAMDAALGAQAG